MEALIIEHDYSRGTHMWCDTYIGYQCVIGGRAIILPGVALGNHVFVGAGSVVTRSFQDNCLIAGNPARITRTGIEISDKVQITASKGIFIMYRNFLKRAIDFLIVLCTLLVIWPILLHIIFPKSLHFCLPITPLK